MRCSTAVMQVLAMHPRYAQHEEIMAEAMALSETLLKGKQLDCTFIMNMPVEKAYSILDPEIPRLIKTQRPSGMWKTKDSQRISYGVLKALKHSGHLASLLREDRFRHDPFREFRDASDYYGLVVRRNIMAELLPTDARLREQLVSDILATQDEDGSWNQTVISTSNHIESLVELGLDLDDRPVRKSADWLLSTCAEDVYRKAKKVNGVVAAHNMFSSQDRKAEFQSALAEKPNWNPVSLCYMHLPMIQTGAALKALMRLGFENDRRVIAACDNLLFLKQTYGGWCETNIRIGLLAEQKAAKRNT